MQRNIMPEGEYQEVAQAFKRGGKQYYFLRINPKQYGDGLISVIEHQYDHEPTQGDRESLYASWLSVMKSEKVRNIDEYDKSDSVNVFEIGGARSWLDKATRVGLVNSLTIEKAAGHTDSTLYLNGVVLVLPIDDALAMLAELELYAIECYRTTEAHKAAVKAMSVIEDVENYDYKTGYPQHPVFNV